jgi:hypothetical protein
VMVILNPLNSLLSPGKLHDEHARSYESFRPDRNGHEYPHGTYSVLRVPL